MRSVGLTLLSFIILLLSRKISPVLLCEATLRCAARAHSFSPGLSVVVPQQVQQDYSYNFAFEELREEDYIGVNLSTGEIVEGELEPTCEISMHLGCYLVREDIKAIIHTHPPLTIGVISGGMEIKPMFPDFVALVGEVPVIDYVIPAGEEIRKAVTEVIKNYEAVLLRNHGVVTVGANLKEAFYRTCLIEESARALVTSMTVGKPRFLMEKEIEGIRNLKAEDYRKTLLKKG